ncbi:MAG: PAS domain S-box protein, partial [candidate division Zixibacteria bacterium]|nr:PAS domain S-box protein [candidate division Zixibacteria bacterium]
GDRSQLVVVVATTRAGETADVSWDDDDLIGWRESLARGRAVVGSVRTFPSVEQEHLRSHGIGSIVAVPIVIRDRWFGYLRLVSSDEERQWDDEDVRLLKTMAEVIGLHIERNRARAAVLDSEQRYSTLVETAPDGIAAICEETRLFLFANSGMCGLTGYESPELLRLSLDQLISCEAREEPLTLLWRRDEREQYNLANVPMVRKTGEVIYVNIRGVKGTISGVPAIIGFFRDVTEILQKERMLQQQKQNLKELTNHVIQLQEHDRRYVARELHDGVGQLLSLTRLHLERALLQHNGGGRNSLLQASETITAAADDLRRIATRMRPEMLDHLGLIPTMEWYLRTFTSGIESTLEVHGTARQLETNCETNLFRVFQELLANVHRHSRAKRVSVTVTFEDNAVRMVVRDDGIGFSVDGVKRRRSLHSSFGLLNMTERIDLLRGKLDIESGSGIGTTVTISVPNV